MLDANLIKFVEPIGPGQIVDRESLVALPVGQIQVTIETSQERVIVRILAMRGADDTPLDDDQSSNWNVSAYVWQNGQVIAGEKHVDLDTINRASRPKLATIGRKRLPGTKSFKFAKEPSDQDGDTNVVDAILQICVYKSPIGAVQRKVFLGTVHIALNYLTSDEFDPAEDSVVCSEEWFKVFPKSTFLPGCPSSIAKTNCAISVSKPQVAEEQRSIPPRSIPPRCREMVRSSSTISYKQLYGQATRPIADSNASSPSCESLSSVNPGKSPDGMKSRVTTWVKRKLLRQATDPAIDTGRQRTPDSAKSEVRTDDAPVIVGPRLRAYTSPSRMCTTPPPIAVEAPTITNNDNATHLPLPAHFRSAKGNARKNRYQASRSNNSSFDVGYESGRSRCLSSSDEEASPKSADSGPHVQCEKSSKGASRKVSHKAQVHEHKANARPAPHKQRPTVLKRSSRITSPEAFTSFSENERQSSKASLDSAICANS